MLAVIALVLNVVHLITVTSPMVTSDADHGTELQQFFTETRVTPENFSMFPPESRTWKNGNVYFYIYTRKNALKPEPLLIPKKRSNLTSKYFNASNNIKVLAHGWHETGNEQWLLDVKDLYLDRYDINVITVDWGELALTPAYPWSAAATRYVGKQLSKLLDSLVKSFKMQGEQMHLIGHSLGAQVVGFAGKFFSNLIKRITGLDPARPLFELPPMRNDSRLTSGDAEFVDIIHTCAGVYGYLHSHGQADYYPNGGKYPQPGCGNQKTTSAKIGCSHHRSYEFFKESIQNDTTFTSYQCESYEKFKKGHCRDKTSLMGEPANEKSRGDYYLNTRSEYPYTLN